MPSITKFCHKFKTLLWPVQDKRLEGDGRDPTRDRKVIPKFSITRKLELPSIMNMVEDHIVMFMTPGGSSFTVLKTFELFLSLRYSADFRRSRLVFFFSLQSHAEWSTFLTLLTILQFLQFLLTLRSSI